MNTRTIIAGDKRICHVLSRKILIRNTQDALDLMANADSEYIVLHDYNFEKDFYELSTRKLGEVLQKFTNYRIKLAIIGNYARYPGETLKDFIYESNKHGEYLFVSTPDQAVKIWNAI